MKKLILSTLPLLFFACGGPVDLDSNEDAVTGTNIDRSLVVRDPEILARFAFTRTMDSIRGTAAANGETLDPAETRLAIYQRWMRSFGDGADGCTRSFVDPNDYGLACPRTPEAKLATINPFPGTAAVQFVPVGLFNRFDLMPTNGATCGEYRVVYAMNISGTAPLGGRAFIIFEAALPNPTPALGVEGCLPVAQFWQSLTNDDSVTSRATKLENFYYKGTAIPGFSAVIRAQNYGFSSSAGPALKGRPGQIRTNFFVDNVEWHLREFKVQTNCPTPSTCKVLFQHQTVKVNPAEELFKAGHARSADFLAAFPKQVQALAAGTLTGIAMTINNNFNEFESVSQASNVVYRTTADAAMRAAIQAELTRIGSTLSVNSILNRATTQTCAGCHQVSTFSPNNALGGGLTWPGTLGFVHIDEGSTLSPALRTVFLPHRRDVLEKFITDREARVAFGALPEGQTIDGRPVDAAN